MNQRSREHGALWCRAGGAALALVLGLGPAGAQQSSQPRPSQPAQGHAAPRPAPIDRNGVLILIRSTLMALDHANRTGNYTVLRDLSAPGFQATNNPARLGEIFSNLRAQKLDLSGVAVLEPQLGLLPQIEANGLMRLAGFFPSVPLQVNFEMMFAPVEGQWRLFGISVGLGQSGPAAPSSEAQEGLEPAKSEAKPAERSPAPAHTPARR
jgi:hypothetical protein